MSEASKEKKEILKQILQQLHSGASAQEMKIKFKNILDNTTSVEIAALEQELVKEGLPREELHRLCDVHLAVFGDQVANQELRIPAGHPVNILLEEHKILLGHAERIRVLLGIIEPACDSVYAGDALDELQRIVNDIHGAEKHYLREENVLFPLMEKHGITEPPAIMWMEHNKIRDLEKELHKVVQNWNSVGFQEFKLQLIEASKSICGTFADHFFKENNILFPYSLQVITEEEWVEARNEFDEIGYCCFTPPAALAKLEMRKPSKSVPEVADVLHFDTGALSREEIEGIFNALPVDISFIDKDDHVKYFNKAEKRIFVRTKAVLGRSVQMCHPEKSIQTVNRILEAFQNGEKDSAEFWINVNDRLVHIRYFAVRDRSGTYLGTMEVTQDLTDMKRIEGQKRLLDWRE
jgi:PAS domain S-box-containing protein